MTGQSPRSRVPGSRASPRRRVLGPPPAGLRPPPSRRACVNDGAHTIASREVVQFREPIRWIVGVAMTRPDVTRPPDTGAMQKAFNDQPWADLHETHSGLVVLMG